MEAIDSKTELPATPPSAETFEDLFLPLAARAYRLAMSLTRDAAEAEDLLQEAALAAYRGFSSFTPGSNFKAWLYRILINRHRYRYRCAARQPLTVDVDDVEELYLYRRTGEAGLHRNGDDPAAALLRRMTSEQVRSAVASLPDEFRAAVSLFFLEEMSYDAIAEILGCPVGTVRSRLYRGRRKLQAALWQIASDAGIVGLLAPAQVPSR